jgi:hypothetical protein
VSVFERGALSLLLAMLPACGQQLVEFPLASRTRSDAARTDLVVPDAVNGEARPADTSDRDPGNRDGGSSDAAEPNATSMDASEIDGPTIDAADFDVEVTDLGNLSPGDKESSPDASGLMSAIRHPGRTGPASV